MEESVEKMYAVGLQWNRRVAQLKPGLYSRKNVPAGSFEVVKNVKASNIAEAALLFIRRDVPEFWNGNSQRYPGPLTVPGASSHGGRESIQVLVAEGAWEHHDTHKEYDCQISAWYVVNVSVSFDFSLKEGDE